MIDSNAHGLISRSVERCTCADKMCVKGSPLACMSPSVKNTRQEELQASAEPNDSLCDKLLFKLKALNP